MFAMPWLRFVVVLVGATTCVEVVGEGAFAGTNETPIDVGTRKQLFIDRKFVESSRNVELVMNPPYQTGEILTTADQPHEVGGMAYLYSSVLKDDGLIRVWYDLAGPNKERRVCYAESDDGVRFAKPELGFHEQNGSTANNIVIPGVIGGCSVWIDPNAPPEHRYKTQAKVYPAGKFQMHSSPDGLHWSLFVQPDLSGPIDTQTIVFWDPPIQRYVMYTREWIRSPSPLNYRAVRRLESDDLKKWDSQSRVLEPDETDLATYETLLTEHPRRGPIDQRPVDYYGATVFKYPAEDPDQDSPADDRVYIMLAQAFWHFTDRGYDGKLGPYVRDVRLAVSRDGKTFQRAGNRAAFLRPGPAGRFDSKQIWALPNPIQMGDEIWIYYAGTNVDRTGRTDSARIDPQAPGGARLGGIGRAIMRLDGFLSADAPYEGGELVTPLIRFKGSKLELNVDTGGGGSVLVELLDSNLEPIEGFSREEATPVNGNSVRMPVSWGEVRDVSALAGTPVRIRFIMRDCKLYAFQFRD